jgi:phage/plasmid-like protein (TIGR03299 family)
MSHGLEQKTALDGTTYTAFAAYKKPGWHALGEVFTEELNAQQRLEKAHMAGWNVRLQPMNHFLSMVPTDARELPGEISEESTEILAANMPSEVPYTIGIDGYNVILRNNPFDGKPEVFGVAKSRYTPVQNEDLLELGEAIINFEGNEGATWETAGSIDGGQQVFATIKFPEAMTIGSGDMIEQYLMLTTGHNGQHPVRAMATNVRVVCANTLKMALGGRKNGVTFKHTAEVLNKMEAAKQSLIAAHQYNKTLALVANELIAIDLNTDGFVKLVKHHWPEVKPVEAVLTLGQGDEPQTIVTNKKSVTMWKNRMDKMVSVWEEDTPRGETLGEARGTVWGGVNAITETLDWHGSTSGGFMRAAGFTDSNIKLQTEVLEYAAKKNGIKTKELSLVS